MTINMSDESQPRATSRVSVAATEEQRRPARRRLWNYDLARVASAIGKSKKLQDVEKYVKMKIIHPCYQEDVKNKKGKVLEESKDAFLMVCDAFVCHHAKFTCLNYQQKSYCTQCGCMTDFISGENYDDKMKQVCECLWVCFFMYEGHTSVGYEGIFINITFY